MRFTSEATSRNTRVKCRELISQGIDRISGVLDPSFNSQPGPNAPVFALAISGQNLYAGGEFSSYRGNSSVDRFAKLDAETGAADLTFHSNPSFDGYSEVRAIAVASDAIYIGGYFEEYRGAMEAAHFAKLDPLTGDFDPGFHSTPGPDSTVNCIAVLEQYLYLGGDFSSYRENSRGRNLAKINRNSGALETTNFHSGSSSLLSSPVHSIVASSSGLYVGGDFVTFQSDRGIRHLVKLDPVSGTPDPVFHSKRLTVDRRVRAMSLQGSTLYLGGVFNSHGAETRLAFLSKYDPRTGVPDPGFHGSTPLVNNAVFSLALSGSSLFVGGGFGSFNGVSNTRYLAKIDPDTANPDPAFHLASGPSGTVQTVLPSPSGDFIYVGGVFSNFRSAPNTAYLVKVDATDGTPDPGFSSATGATSTVNALALNSTGTILYAGGEFFSYRGETNARYLAKIDTTNGAPDLTFSSETGPNAAVQTILLDPTDSVLYVGGSFTNYRSVSEASNLAKIDAHTGALDTSFSSVAGPNGAVHALAFDSIHQRLYVGGQFSSYRGEAVAQYLAKVDAQTGDLDLDFNSTKGPNSWVYGIRIDGKWIDAFGTLSSYRGILRENIARILSATGELDSD